MVDLLVRGANVIVRDLSASANASQAPVLPAMATQGDWSRSGTRAVFLTGSDEKSEMWMLLPPPLKRIPQQLRPTAAPWV